MKYEEDKASSGVGRITKESLGSGRYDGRMVRGVGSRTLYIVTAPSAGWLRRVISLDGVQQFECMSDAYEVVPPGTTVTLTQE